MEVWEGAKELWQGLEKNTQERCGTVEQDVQECTGGQCVPSTERLMEGTQMETNSSDLRYSLSTSPLIFLGSRQERL